MILVANSAAFTNIADDLADGIRLLSESIGEHNGHQKGHGDGAGEVAGKYQTPVLQNSAHSDPRPFVE